jgi:hypothetical protein
MLADAEAELLALGDGGRVVTRPLAATIDPG